MNVSKQTTFRCLAVLALAAGGLVLVLGLLTGAAPAVTPVRAQVLPQGQHCAFQSITVTAALGPTPGVSDTVPGGATDRGVYFSNPNPTGVITVSVILTPVRECYLGNSPAFGVTVPSQHEVHSPPRPGGGTPPPRKAGRSRRTPPPQISTWVKASSSDEPASTSAVSPTRYSARSGSVRAGSLTGSSPPRASTASTTIEDSTSPPQGSLEESFSR